VKTLNGLTLFLATSLSVVWAQRPTIPQLMKDADAIVVGVAQGVTETALGFDTQLQVLRTLKGSPAPGMPIRLQVSRRGWPDRSPQSCPEPCVLSFRNRTTGVFFLQSNAVSWTPLAVRYGGGGVAGLFLDLYIPAADTLSSSASAWLNSQAEKQFDGALQDMFLAEVLSAVEARVPRGTVAWGNLTEFENRSVVSVLRIVRKSTLAYEDMRDLALSLLLKRRDPESFSDLVHSGPAVSKSREFRSYFTAIQNTRSDSPDVIAGLRSVFDAPEMPTELRYAAANALANIHTRPLLPLFEKWLFDTDPILQAYGAVGIGMIANGCGVSKERELGCVMGSEAPRPRYWVPELHEKQMFGFVASKYNVALAAPRVAFWQDWWNQSSTRVLNDPTSK
jgi:hypothetical protein